MDDYARMVEVLRKHGISAETVLEQTAHRYLLAAAEDFSLAGRTWLAMGRDLLETADAIRGDKHGTSTD